MQKILFYEGNHYYLSNFSSFEVKVRGFTFKTSEHAYQALRFDTKSQLFIDICKARSAYEAKKIAHNNIEQQLEIYDTADKRIPLMYEILIEKVNWDRTGFIKKNLTATSNSILEENSPSDYFWGIGSDNSGENWLGKLWMVVRFRLKCSHLNEISTRNMPKNKDEFMKKYSNIWQDGVRPPFGSIR